MKRLQINTLDINDIENILSLLFSDADVVVISYNHLVVGGWLCGMQKEDKSFSRFSCFNGRKQSLSFIVDSLKRSNFLDVTDTDFFAIVRLRPEFSSESGKRMLEKQILGTVSYPILIDSNLRNQNSSRSRLAFI